MIAVIRPRALHQSKRGSPSRDDAVVVKDPAVFALREQAGRTTRGSLSVLLLGETGVCKEVLARKIHASSPRANKPFVVLNCAAFAESLLESELFGYEKGAFTGTQHGRPGLLKAAEGGTVFLDEVRELSLTTQAKLLRMRQERQMLHIGARSARTFDARFIAATNRDLEVMVVEGSFRRSLYFRLNGISFIPPLGERVADIAPLAQHFATEAYRELDRLRQRGRGDRRQR